MLRIFSRIAIGICVFMGGVWCWEFIRNPDRLSAIWIGIAVACIIANTPEAIRKEKKTNDFE